MSRWCKGVAVVAAWLGLGVSGWAQSCCDGRMPSPVGAARMPEPLPCGPSKPVPPLVPGPLTPEMAPPGPCPDLSLPADHSSAFQCECFPPEQACYASVGWMALKRSGLPRNTLAVLDPQNLDTGIRPPPGRPTALTFDNINPQVGNGVRGTLGYLSGNNAIELTGFYIFENTTRVTRANPGRLDSFFFNPPLGFEGDNGLWLQADVMRTALTYSIADGELNWRCWNVGIHGADLIVGVRYFNYRETFSFFTGDDDLTVRDINNRPDPRRQATYLNRVRNQIVAPQVGFEYTTPLPQPHKSLGCPSWLSAVWVGMDAKGAVGANFIRFHNSLVRGDGRVGFDSSHDTTKLGQVYEIGAFVDIHILERARVRAGYNALWALGIAPAPEQLDFNLANPAGRRHTNGDLFFHGPMVELQLLF